MRAIAAWILFATQAASALAAGPNDGVYQRSTHTFRSVHQNGGTLLVISLGSVSTSGFGFSIGPSVVYPASIGSYDYALGPFAGNSARVIGTTLFGVCSVTTDVTFDGQGNMSETFVEAVNTPMGTQQGVNCVSLYQSAVGALGPTLTFQRLF